MVGGCAPADRSDGAASGHRATRIGASDAAFSGDTRETFPRGGAVTNSIRAVVVRWRGGDEVHRCMRSLLDDGGPDLKHVVVVDSGSGDGGAERLATEFAEIEVIPLGENHGFAHAAEALVGRGVGAGRRRHIVDAIRLSGWWSLWFAGAMALLYLLLGQWIVSLMTDIASVRETTALFLPWMVLSPLLSVWSFWLDGVFIGATRGREISNTAPPSRPLRAVSRPPRSFTIPDEMARPSPTPSPGAFVV